MDVKLLACQHTQQIPHKINTAQYYHQRKDKLWPSFTSEAFRHCKTTLQGLECMKYIFPMHLTVSFSSSHRLTSSSVPSSDSYRNCFCGQQTVSSDMPPTHFSPLHPSPWRFIFAFPICLPGNQKNTDSTGARFLAR